VVRLQEIAEEALVRTCEGLRASGFDYLKCINAVDDVTDLEVVYTLYNTASQKQEQLKVRLPADQPAVDTIKHLYPAADWYERQMHEMFGITVRGGSNARLLLEGWDGIEAPLRKSFNWGGVYKRTR
jgi:NADH-quinone oxidoreductase subunit C